ncbi:phosphoglucomutase [Priestia abyssalis]|uniref:phosphoglucomutase n=1 Tax=Priestia abyssalis TaxID=1221450 RepID=UPI000994CF95|nr:phosphoglucomutase [Priestia abyssalis]
MPYPDEIDKFNEKLNKSDVPYVIEEEVTLVNGIYEGMLIHDNIIDSSVRVYTGSKLTGEKIDNFILSIPANTDWKRSIKIFSNAEKLYVTYESYGDQVEAEDINLLQESVVATQAEVERYKKHGIIDGGTFVHASND